MIVLRGFIYALALAALTPPYALIAMASFVLPRRARFRVISGWAHCVVYLVRFLYGIRWRVEGIEHLPARPVVLLSNHQSVWETVAFQTILPPHAYVLKRELLWIPFFGWGLAAMSPIAIDRARGSAALRQLARKGARRLAQGLCVVVFPEGTRVTPGTRHRFRLGGAWLAVASEAPVVPVAHNAGLFWPSGPFPRRAGTVTVRIGPAIATQGREPQSVNDEAKAWIDAQQEALCAAR